MAKINKIKGEKGNSSEGIKNAGEGKIVVEMAPVYNRRRRRLTWKRTKTTNGNHEGEDVPFADWLYLATEKQVLCDRACTLGSRPSSTTCFYFISNCLFTFLFRLSILPFYKSNGVVAKTPLFACLMSHVRILLHLVLLFIYYYFKLYISSSLSLQILHLNSSRLENVDVRSTCCDCCMPGCV